MTDPEGIRHIQTLVEGAPECVPHIAVRRSDQLATHHHREANHLAWLKRRSPRPCTRWKSAAASEQIEYGRPKPGIADALVPRRLAAAARADYTQRTRSARSAWFNWRSPRVLQSRESGGYVRVRPQDA